MKMCTIETRKNSLTSSLFAIALFLTFVHQTAAQSLERYVYVQKTSDCIEGGFNGVLKIGLHYPVPLPADVVVTYSYLPAGQAQLGIDFSQIPAFTGSVVIPAGTTETLLQVDASNDGIIEGPESAGIQLTSAVSGATNLPIDPLNSSAQVTIIDANSASSTPIQILTGANATEPSGQGSFTVKLAGVATSAWPVRIGYRLSGTASVALDCLPFGEIIIPPNTNSVTVTINPLDDHIIEPQENITIELLSGCTTDGGGNSFIFPPDPANNDIAPTISDNDYTPATTLMSLTKIADASEPATAGTIRMGLPGDYVSSANAAVNIQFEGTASIGEDYNNSLTILPAYYNYADVSLTILDDTLNEETETVLCTLVGATDSNLLQYPGSPGQNVVSVDITDDDANLPLRLVSFDGRMQDNGAVQLVWNTADEENTAHFEVQRSRDGRSFGQIGVVPASGTGDHAYTFADPDPLSDNFYRLRMVDQDGSFTFSRIIVVSTNSQHPISVFPNPAKNQLTVDFGDQKFLPARATIVDSSGRPHKKVSIGKSRTTIPLDGLASGLYFLSVENGESIKFVVQ